jgi:anti-sigma factor RsiW
MTEHPGERLSAYLDDELPAAEASAVEDHLRGCEECRRRLETLAAVDRVARDLPVTAPPGYFDALPGRVRVLLEAPASAAAGPRPVPSRRPRSSPLRLPAWTWAVAAVLALAVVTPLTLIRLQSPGVTIPTSDRRVGAPPAPVEAVPELRDGVRPFVEENKEASKRQKEESPRAARVGAELQGAVPEQSGSAEAKATAGSSGAGLTANAAPPAADHPSAMADRMTKDAVSREAEAGAAASFAPPPPEPRPAPRVPGAGYAQAQGAPAPSAPAPAASEALKLSREEPMDEGAAPEPAARGREEAAPAAAATGATRAERDDAAADEYARLLPPPPPTADALRARREAWRAFALRHPEGAPADEARVRVVEMGLAAWRLGGEDKDLRRAREDAAAYLRRPDAAQAARVRALVAGLPAAP